MKRGTAEQEQNGVTVPSSAASTLPADSPAAGEHPPGALGREERARDAHAEDHQGEEQEDLRPLEEEELDREESRVPRGRRSAV